jgi:PKHD-type hydroxylase
MKTARHVYSITLLSPEAVQQVQQMLDRAPFVDGKATAIDAAKEVKNNLQIDANDRTVLPHLQQIIGNALMAEPKFQHTFYAVNAYPFLFSKYGPGMGYGKHVDSPFMGNPPVRTDLAMTVFLDDPSTYEGGELVICDGENDVMYKPRAGEAVIYPCQYLHYVNEVTKGTRRVCVTWFRCSVRNAEQRQILSDIKETHTALAATDPQGKHTQLLLQTWSNLWRMWGDV